MCLILRNRGYHFGKFDVYYPWDVMNYLGLADDLKNKFTLLGDTIGDLYRTLFIFVYRT